MTTSSFDPIAAQFDRFRALPPGVPSAIRNALWTALGHPTHPRLLDLGAGTGRIGEAFVSTDDAYVAVDPSAQMLAQFAEKARNQSGRAPLLVQADGSALPFAQASFDVVLIVQVLSGSKAWRSLLGEARRVLHAGGALVLGQTTAPPDGIDARMRAQLAAILADTGVDPQRPGAGRDDARSWLEPQAERLEQVVAARWEATRSPRDFLARHATGARFSTLPASVREKALKRLADWATAAFGGLDPPFVEPRSFNLDIYRFQES